jgi:hypothetical protein
MDQKDFKTPTELYAYAERTGNVYVWEGMLAFAKRQRVLSPDQYQIVDVRTSKHGVRRVMLFSKAILQAEWEADAPVREAMAIKRARREAQRVEKARRAAERAVKWEAEQARRAAERRRLAEWWAERAAALKDKQ